MNSWKISDFVLIGILSALYGVLVLGIGALTVLLSPAMHALSPALIGISVRGEEDSEVRCDHAVCGDQHGALCRILGDDVCAIRRLGDGGGAHHRSDRFAPQLSDSRARGGLRADSGSVRVRRRDPAPLLPRPGDDSLAGGGHGYGADSEVRRAQYGRIPRGGHGDCLSRGLHRYLYWKADFEEAF